MAKRMTKKQLEKKLAAIRTYLARPLPSLVHRKDVA